MRTTNLVRVTGAQGSQEWTTGRVLRVLGVAVLGAVVLLLVYGVAVEPRLILDERHYDVSIPGLDPDLDGVEVAVFSDLQVGMWWDNTAMVERAVSAVLAEQPDAVLLGGDYLYSENPDPTTQVDTVTRVLEPIAAAGIPTFAVLGNHDYAAGAAEQVRVALESLGFTVLHNEAVPMLAPRPGSGSPVYVVGLAPTKPGLTDVAAALAGLPESAPRVVLLHNPTAFPRLPANAAPLAVAGHTHCGQIALPGLAHWSYLGLTEQESVVVDGFAYDEYGATGNALFVTCGIGFSLVPVRINAAPQVVFFDLRAG